MTGYNSEEELVETYHEMSRQLHRNNLLENSSSASEPKHPVLAGVVFTNSFEEGSEEFPSTIEVKLFSTP